MPYSFCLFMIFNIFFGISAFISDDIPIVISTWNFDKAVAKAWSTLESTNSALDSIEAGCSACEILQCDGTVGYGGSPDENGETTLDAMIMDGTSMNVGAVASLRRIKNAISVARAVLDKTEHSILVGGSATEFAKEMGFKEESLTTEKSTDIWLNWKKNSCQPNFWKNVRPNPRESCGPYSPAWDSTNNIKPIHKFDKRNHDTIGMIVIDEKGNIAAGTSSNGAHYKIPGRVGDSPIPGSGSYADSSVGGAAATGDGDVMLRFLPSFLAVEEMRTGSSPKHAAMKAVKRIYKFYPNFSGAVIAVNKTGAYGAACAGIDSFPYSVRSKNMKKVEIVSVQCLTNKEQPSILFV